MKQLTVKLSIFERDELYTHKPLFRKDFLRRLRAFVDNTITIKLKKRKLKNIKLLLYYLKLAILYFQINSTKLLYLFLMIYKYGILGASEITDPMKN